MFTLYDRATGQMLSTCEGQGDGEDRVDEFTGVLPGHVPSDMYLDPTSGKLQQRPLVDIKFDKPDAVEGEQVTVIGVPDDAILVFRGEPTKERTFTMEKRSIRVILVGKYIGFAVCAPISEDELRERALKAVALDEVRKSARGVAVMAAPLSEVRQLYTPVKAGIKEEREK